MNSQSDSTDKPGRSAGGKRAMQARETKNRILKAAVKEFAEAGFSGGRIDRISTEANSNDRMIYYYFGNKDKLFLAVLEATYIEFYEAEKALNLDTSDPIAALKQVISFTFDYYLQHPEFVAILNDENLHRAKRSQQSENIRNISGNIQGNLVPILQVGKQQGLFRESTTASHLYLTISALTYFYCSNQHTLTVFVGEDFQAPEFQTQWLEHICDVVLRSVLIDPAAQGR